jgi:hypothetical protein
MYGDGKTQQRIVKGEDFRQMSEVRYRCSESERRIAHASATATSGRTVAWKPDHTIASANGCCSVAGDQDMR